jgi:hypothetical protein
VERGAPDMRPTGMRLWWVTLMLALSLIGCSGTDSEGPEAASSLPDTVTSTAAKTASTPSTDAGLLPVQGEAIMVLGCVEGPGIVCRRLHVSARIEVRAAGGSGVVAQTATARDGTFELELPAGEYSVTATVTSDIKAKPVQASLTVEPGTEAELVLRFHIGAGRPFLLPNPSPR